MFSPSKVPSRPENVYVVEDDYGPIGRSFRETRPARQLSLRLA